MKRLFYILLLFSLAARAEYDSTYCLTITQKYAIPEDVYNGDVVGLWLKCFTYRSGNTITYSILENFNSAFAITKIDNDSAKITIIDASAINGKIVQQDTTINLIIRTTDAVLGYEDDTCVIAVKENAYCSFFDYSQISSGDSTRSAPYNDLDDIGNIRAGYGYFIKRGNDVTGETETHTKTIATAAHPTIIAAYGSGAKPYFHTYSGKFFYIQEDGSHEGSEYIHFYDLDIRDYGDIAINVWGASYGIGVYNCDFAGNMDVQYLTGAADIYFQKGTDATDISGNEVINCTSVGTLGALLKLEVSGVTTRNVYVDPYAGYTALRVGTYSNRTEHFYTTGGYEGISFRWDTCYAIDGVVENMTNSGILFNPSIPSGSNGSDSVILQNILFRNNTTAAIYYYENRGSVPTTKNYILDCLFDNNDVGILSRSSISNGMQYLYIKRNTFLNSPRHIYIQYSDANAMDDFHIDYNVFDSATVKCIDIDEGTDIDLHNNMVIGDIDLTDVTSGVQKSNYFKALTNPDVTGNNIDLDTITKSLHFVNYAAKDYHLLETALSAIDSGYYWGQPYDHDKRVKSGTQWDIGAYEFISSEPGPEIEDTDTLHAYEYFIGSCSGGCSLFYDADCTDSLITLFNNDYIGWYQVDMTDGVNRLAIGYRQQTIGEHLEIYLDSPTGDLIAVIVSGDNTTDCQYQEIDLGPTITGTRNVYAVNRSSVETVELGWLYFHYENNYIRTTRKIQGYSLNNWVIAE